MTEIYIVAYVIAATVICIVSLFINQVSYYKRLEEVNKNNKGWILLAEQENLKTGVFHEKIAIIFCSLLWVITIPIVVLATIFFLLSKLINRAAKKYYEKQTTKPIHND